VSSGPADDTKEQVRQAIDIVDLVGSYLTLRRQGRNFVALCPWHDDTKPSLQVNQERQSWKCWVCDVGGDIFSFLMRRENIDFREALQMLADRAGIELSARPRAAAKPGSPQDKRTLYQAAEWAEQQFHEYLLRSPEAESARRYIEERGITPASVKRFRIGYSPNSWQWLLDRARSTQFSEQVLRASGLAGRSESSGRFFDFFRGRVLFPIRDTQRRVIAFGGRVLPEVAKQEEAQRGRPPGKYVNSPDSRLFSKSEQLYGLDVAIDSISKSPEKNLVVVEGYTDVVMAHQCGMQNVVAVLGTALNQQHIGLLRRFADTVTLVLDGDEAGQRRTNEILELFVATNIDLRIMTLPEGLDPFDFLCDNGADPFRELVANAIDALEHKIYSEIRGIDLARDTHRASRALENILNTVAKTPRLQAGTTSSTRLREQQILTRLGRDFRISESEVRTRLNEIRRTKTKTSRSSTGLQFEQQPSEITISSLESEFIEILLLHSELIETTVLEIPSKWLHSREARTIYETLCGLHLAGEPIEFPRVMSEIEDPRLKNLLVDLDEQAHKKASQTQVDAAGILRGLIDTFLENRLEGQRREQLAALDDNNLEQEEEIDLLRQLFEQQRSRQGISAPTDG